MNHPRNFGNRRLLDQVHRNAPAPPGLGPGASRRAGPEGGARHGGGDALGRGEGRAVDDGLRPAPALGLERPLRGAEGTPRAVFLDFTSVGYSAGAGTTASVPDDLALDRPAGDLPRPSEPPNGPFARLRRARPRLVHAAADAARPNLHVDITSCMNYWRTVAVGWDRSASCSPPECPSSIRPYSSRMSNMRMRSPTPQSKRSAATVPKALAGGGPMSEILNRWRAGQGASRLPASWTATRTSAPGERARTSSPSPPRRPDASRPWTRTALTRPASSAAGSSARRPALPRSATTRFWSCWRLVPDRLIGFAHVNPNDPSAKCWPNWRLRPPAWPALHQTDQQLPAEGCSRGTGRS